MIELYRKLNDAQQRFQFKVIASIVVLVLAVAASVFMAVRSARQGEELPPAEVPAELTAPVPAGADGKPDAALEQAQLAMRNQTEMAVRLLNDLRSSKLSIGSSLLAVASIAAVLLVVIWLGLALTYLALGFGAVVLAGPLVAIGYFNIPVGVSPATAGQIGWFIAGALALAASFSALVRGASGLLAGSHPVTAIARNVLAEAVRMKISLVFIVLLIVLMAALPGLLDASTPLRYRVQTFLQYSTSGAFTLVSILCIFLGTASVCFEQRDKIIWQTATKPVQPWQYVLGKWLGVTVVGVVLMSVCSVGVFLFTSYLRQQPAIGEVEAYVPRNPEALITEDRLILEYQILVGRVSERPVITEEKASEIIQAVEQKYELAMRIYREDTAKTAEVPDKRKIRAEVEREKLSQFLSVAPGERKRYEFDGLLAARELGKPLTLRYAVSAGANMPNELYKVTFSLPDMRSFIKEVHLGQSISMPIPASSIDRKTGNLMMEITNGDESTRIANPEVIQLPADGFEVSFPVTGFFGNFIRVALVCCFKIGFLSMVAVGFGTFLAFPVANLVSFGVFICAESASFLSDAVDNLRTEEDGHIIIWAWVAEKIAMPIAASFRFYADVRPVSNLVDGKLLPWPEVNSALFIMLLLTALLFAVASFIFRSRELATYSGQ